MIININYIEYIFTLSCVTLSRNRNAKGCRTTTDFGVGGASYLRKIHIRINSITRHI